jgi:16S rRNA (cytidine1402-2'-O)-methyltransferase
MLYLVGTPIGNLGDMTQRAIDTLKSVDLVVSEDTRKTGFLLQHFEIKKAQLSFREDNEERTLPRLLEFLKQGKNAALVTDAGTPGISDPGFTLVRAALAEGIKVEAIPGASACIQALILSGLAVHSFTFRGFPPHKGGPRKRFLEIDKDSPHTLIFYESPYRLGAFLTDALEIYGDRRVAIANDLTKKFELVERGKISEFIEKYKTTAPRGEYTVVIEGKV